MNDSDNKMHCRLPDESIINHVERLSKLELTQEQHDKMIRIILDRLDPLVKEFTQVKYAVFGALALFVLSELGLVQAIKLFFMGSP